ncbi:hypothetical protein BGW37DRAFT_463261 [Umbelopsis sp. PMI_123]|nr:hypothetical protein BGW37DRAFT_463261 [Umbelopsis sp. PMI_123]
MKCNTGFHQLPLELLYEIFYHLSEPTNEHSLDGCATILNVGYVNRACMYIAFRYLNNNDVQYLAKLLNWATPLRQYPYRSRVVQFIRTVNRSGFSEKIDIAYFTLDFHSICRTTDATTTAAADIQTVFKLCHLKRLEIIFDADFGKSKDSIKRFLGHLQILSPPDTVQFSAYCPQRRCQCCCAKGYDLQIASFVKSLKVTSLVLQQMQPGSATLAALRNTRELTLDRCADSSFIAHVLQQMPYLKRARLLQDDLTVLSSKFLTRLATSTSLINDFRIHLISNNWNDELREISLEVMARAQQQIRDVYRSSDKELTMVDINRFLKETGFSINGNELVPLSKAAPLCLA